MDAPSPLATFVGATVPELAHRRSAFLAALIDALDALEPNNERTVEHALAVERTLCRYTLQRRTELSAEHRALVWSARCRLVHFTDNQHVVDAPLRIRYGLAWAGTVAEEAATIDRDDERLRQWFGEQRLFAVPERPYLDAYGVMALWKTLLLLLEHWPHLGYTVWAEAAVRRMRAAFAAYVSTVGARSRFNHVSMCRELEAGVWALTSEFVAELEHVFAALERSLASCAGFTWSPAPASAALCMSHGDNVFAAFSAWVAELIASSHRSLIEEDFRTLVYDFYVQPGELELFAEVAPYDRQDAQVCISRRRQADFDALRARLVAPPVERVWEACVESGDGPEYMLLASLAIDYALQTLCDGVEFRSAYFHTPHALPPHARGARHHRSASALFRRRDHNTGTLRYYYKLRYEYGMREARAVSDEANYAHPLLMRLLNSTHVVCADGTVRRCGHFSVAFAEWVREMAEDERVCGRLPNTASLLPIYERLMPARAAEHLGDIERRHDACREEHRPVFADVAAVGKSATGKRRRYQYA